MYNDSTKIVYVKDNYGGKPIDIIHADYITCLRWSPNSKEIYLSAILDSQHIGYILPRLGGKPKKIDLAGIVCWSPDGNFLAGISLSQKTIRIFNSNTNELLRTITLTGDYNWFRDVDWTLNKDRIVCLTYRYQSGSYILWTIKSDGTQQKKILESKSEIYSPRWSANGKYVYYLQGKRSNETRDLMKIGFTSDSEKLNIAPEIVQSGLLAFGFSITKSNEELLYSKYFHYSNFWKLTIDKNKKSFNSEKISNGTSFYDFMSISPNGKKLIFVDHGNIFIKSTNQEASEQLTFLNSYCYSPSWSPDGMQIAFFSDSQVKIMSTKGDILKTFKETEFGDNLFWDTDSTILIQKTGNQNFFILNVKDGKKFTLLADESNGYVFNPRYSNKRDRLAIYWNRDNLGLWLISMTEPQQKLLKKGVIFPLRWTQDDKYIYACELLPLMSFYSNNIQIISTTDGTEKTSIKLPFKNIYDIDITPDGKDVICNIEDNNSDVWMIENFDLDVE